MKFQIIQFLFLFILHGGAQPVLGQSPTPNADFDSDGEVDARDLLILAQQWRQTTDEIITIEIPGLAAGARQMKLVRLPAGTFQIGSPDSERGRYFDWEGPVHTVTLTNDFYIGETEVTQAQWQAVMGSNPASRYGVGNDYPVYNVSWHDITQENGFLARLDAQSSFNGFRLPTAYRSGMGILLPGGNEYALLLWGQLVVRRWLWRVFVGGSAHVVVRE